MKVLGSQKRTVALLWLLLLAALWVYLTAADVSLRELLGRVTAQLQGDAWAPLLLLPLYLLRPLFLFPTTLLTLAAGFLFGAFWGFWYALFATTLSAAVGYLLGRLFATEAPPETPFVGRLLGRTFETVLLSRLLLLPGDVVNGAAGFLRAPLGEFLAASALGGLPGLLVGVLAGAALESDLSGGVRLNATFLALSAALLVSSLGLAQLLRARQGRPKPGES